MCSIVSTLYFSEISCLKRIMKSIIFSLRLMRSLVKMFYGEKEHTDTLATVSR